MTTNDQVQQLGPYEDRKCPVCGVPWEEHTDQCPRHAYRPESVRPLDRDPETEAKAQMDAMIAAVLHDGGA